MKRIASLVVTYNRLGLLQEVIKSLKDQTRENQIIVVNNGSNDGTKEWLELQLDIITITQENLGGAGGFFTGMKFIAEMGFDYCWMMDDDVICYPESLDKLLIAIEKKDNIGFVCSKVVGISGLPMNVPIIDTRQTINGYSNWFDLMQYQMIKVRSATFVSILLTSKIINEVGLPYKEFFIWGDDTEYTTRISQKYDSYFVNESVVMHKREIQEALSFENENDSKRIENYFRMFRNNSFTFLKYNNKNKKIKYLLNEIKNVLMLFFSLKIKKSKVKFTALVSLMSFKPQIIYPDNQQ